MKAFHPIRKLAALAAVAAGAALGGASVASAGTSVVDFTSNTSVKHLGSFSGTATLDSGTDLLTIVMNNTSSKGYLYGLAFDLEGGEKAKDITNDGKHGFKGVGKHGMTVTPYGKYEGGAVDSGSNRRAIAAGAEKTFVFQITGAPSDVTAFGLLDNPDGESIVATFRGFKHGKKDHAGADVVIPVTPAFIDGSTGSDPGSGGTILKTTPVSTGTNNSGGTTSGTINLPGQGGQGSMAIPLPSAAASGITTLALMAGAMARRKIAGLLA